VSVRLRAEQASVAMSTHGYHKMWVNSRSMNNILSVVVLEEVREFQVREFPPGMLACLWDRTDRIDRGLSCAGGSGPAHIVYVKQMKDVRYEEMSRAGSPTS